MAAAASGCGGESSGGRGGTAGGKQAADAKAVALARGKVVPPVGNTYRYVREARHKTTRGDERTERYERVEVVTTTTRLTKVS